MKQKLDELRTLAIKLFEAGQTAKRKHPPEIWGDSRNLQFSDLPRESVEMWDAIALASLTKPQPASQRIYDACVKIASYNSPERVKRDASAMGLEANEAVEMAYENAISDAKAAIHRMRRPKSATTG